VAANTGSDQETQEPDATVAEYFAAVASRGNRGPIGELAVVLSRGILEPVVFLEHVKAHGLGGENWFRRQVLDLSFGFIVAGLDGGAFRPGYLEKVRRLNAFLHIADGDFFEFRPAEIAAVIGEQLDEILSDAEISREEELHQAELQAAFGLGYDDYLALGRTAFERAFFDLQMESAFAGPAQASALRKLQALSPIYRMATARTRTLGSLY
jgi:hypothetical protein